MDTQHTWYRENCSGSSEIVRSSALLSTYRTSPQDITVNQDLFLLSLKETGITAELSLNLNVRHGKMTNDSHFMLYTL